MRPPSRTAWLVVLLATQALIMGTVLAWSATVRDQSRMELGARLPEPQPRIHLPARDLLDTVSFLAGPESLGIELPTPFRRYLSFQEGQMLWFFLNRDLSGSPPLVRLAREAVRDPKQSARIQGGLCDGVLSFLYDLGSQKDLARQNWGGTVVRELQASSLLSWTKKLDFVVLSSLADTSAGGLGFVTDLNPGILLILPTHDPALLQSEHPFSLHSNRVVLPPGLHPLAPGLWALVLEVPVATGHPAELDLLLEGSDGRLVLFSGSGLNSPLASLREARRRMGRDIAMYVGATGYVVGLNTSNLEAELRALNREFPDLRMMPNGDTSLVAHGILEALLGLRYCSGSLGSRVAL